MKDYKHVGIFLAEDLKYKYPDFYKKEVGEHSDNYFWVLCRLDCDGKPYEQLGYDGGEPEDQVLVRDWQWVAKMADDYLDRIYELEEDKKSRHSLDEFFTEVIKELSKQHWSYYTHYTYNGFKIDGNYKYGWGKVSIYCEVEYSNNETGDSEIKFPYSWFTQNLTAKEIAENILKQKEEERLKEIKERETAAKKLEERDRAEYARLKYKYGE